MPPQSRGRRFASHSVSSPNLSSIAGLAPLDTSVGALNGEPHPHTTANESYPIADRLLDGEAEAREEDADDSDSDSHSASSFEHHLLYPPSLPSSSSPSEGHDPEFDDEAVSDDQSSVNNGSSSGSSANGMRKRKRSTPSTAKSLALAHPQYLVHPTVSAPGQSKHAATPSPALTHSVSSSKLSSKHLPQPSSVRPHALYSHPSKSHSSYLFAPHGSHTNQSKPQPPPPSFAPPFYNRPPTPLPPSPSLTSLLRPHFGGALPGGSTFSSRPSTPGPSHRNSLHKPPASNAGSSSDTSLTAATNATKTTTNTSLTAAAVARSALDAPSSSTVPRASPKVPTYEYYGFVLYISSTAVFGVYMLWSFLPTPFLHQLGIYYYPDRWWSLAAPAWLVVLVIYIYVALACWNTEYLTPKVGRLEGIVDRVGAVAVVDEQGRILKSGRTQGTCGVVNLNGNGDTEVVRTKTSGFVRHHRRSTKSNKSPSLHTTTELTSKSGKGLANNSSMNGVATAPVLLNNLSPKKKRKKKKKDRLHPSISRNTGVGNVVVTPPAPDPTEYESNKRDQHSHHHSHHYHQISRNALHEYRIPHYKQNADSEAFPELDDGQHPLTAYHDDDSQEIMAEADGDYFSYKPRPATDSHTVQAISGRDSLGAPNGVPPEANKEVNHTSVRAADTAKEEHKIVEDKDQTPRRRRNTRAFSRIEDYDDEEDVQWNAKDLKWKEIWNLGTDGVMDVPLGGVCEVLYGESSDGSE